MNDMNTDNGMDLINTDDGLVLKMGNMTVKADFSSLKSRVEKNRLNGEMLIKAVGVKNIKPGGTVVDATAGLGEDSFLLAASGLKVIMYEKDEVIADLLSDGLKRAKDDPELMAIVSRMELRCEDSIKAMEERNIEADIIYLDPMFPQRSKSGLIKKKFQLLQRLESPCEDGKRMLMAALNATTGKVIVKRPLKGEYISDLNPSYSIKGRAIRYDCYIKESIKLN